MMPSIQELILSPESFKLSRLKLTIIKPNLGTKQIHTIRPRPNLPKTHKKSNNILIFRGNYYVRDLTDLLVEPHISASDFVYSKFVTTMIVIVPTVSCEEFQLGYGTISDYVIPGSGKKLAVP